MSRRVVDAVDSLLGTPTFRGGALRSRAGVFTDSDGLEPVGALDTLSVHAESGDAGPCTAYRHGRLRGKKRCHGCGRTRNEIEIDGER